MNLETINVLAATTDDSVMTSTASLETRYNLSQLENDTYFIIKLISQDKEASLGPYYDLYTAQDIYDDHLPILAPTELGPTNHYSASILEVYPTPQGYEVIQVREFQVIQL